MAVMFVWIWQDGDTCLIWYIAMIVGHVMRTQRKMSKRIFFQPDISRWWWRQWWGRWWRGTRGRRQRRLGGEPGSQVTRPGVFGSFEPHLHKTRQDVEVGQDSSSSTSPEGRQETRACCWQWRGYWRYTRSRGASGRGTPSTWVLIQLIMLVRICPAHPLNRVEHIAFCRANGSFQE